ncbi:6-carboxytetrahydropterin synthase QueD [Candidatus Wolfebacteria bacterium]|nr:MAG: 6-carboxytetrahydropterin synthase QueD [Candidatus Wolfebacteria bacterium]
MPKKVSVTKFYTFEAAHQLVNHEGKCKNEHGHSYKLEVTVTGTPKQADGSPDEGMIIDFDEMSKIVKKVIDPFDHHNINKAVDYPTTVENIANDIFDRLYKTDLPVSKVRLWETATGSATVEYVE